MVINSEWIAVKQNWPLFYRYKVTSSSNINSNQKHIRFLRIYMNHLKWKGTYFTVKIPPQNIHAYPYTLAYYKMNDIQSIEKERL